MSQAAFKLIEAVEVVRDERGWFWHPGLPDFGEDRQAYQDWFRANCLVARYGYLGAEMHDHPYYDGGDHCSGWEPCRPSGGGWFVLWITDTEEGPCCAWVRRVQE